MIISHYVYQLCVVSAFIIFYYKYVKSALIYCAPKVTRYFSLTQYFPKHDIDGAVELAMIASSHVLLCACLIRVMPIHLPSVNINWIDFPLYFVYGILLGIGCMGLSGLLCKIAVQTIALFKQDNPHDLKSWLTLGRGGWIKHHLQSIEIFPLYISLLVLTMQVGSEEVIFRGVLLNYFMPFGEGIAFFTACMLFILMQALLMHKWQSAIFPMIGAAVMGCVHSILYLHLPLLWPLIIAHVTFFLFSVM